MEATESGKFNKSKAEMLSNEFDESGKLEARLKVLVLGTFQILLPIEY